MNSFDFSYLSTAFPEHIDHSHRDYSYSLFCYTLSLRGSNLALGEKTGYRWKLDMYPSNFWEKLRQINSEILTGIY